MKARFACLIVLLFSLFSAAQAESLDSQWKKLKPGNWEAWLTLAESYERTGSQKGTHRARQIYEALEAYDATAHGIAGRYRLACLLAGKGGEGSHPRAGAMLLADLAAHFDHEKAQARLESLRKIVVRGKEALLQSAGRALEGQRFPDALKEYSRALAMPFACRGGRGEEVSDSHILEALSRIEAHLGESRRVLRNPPGYQCRSCEGDGYTPCSKCRGKGRVRPLGVPTARPVRCPRCKGLMKVPCRPCSLSGLADDTYAMPDRKALYGFLQGAQHLAKTQRLRDAAPKAIEAALLWNLWFPPAVKPDNVEALRLVPFAIKGRPPIDFMEAWKNGDAVGRMNLIMDIGITTSRLASTLKHFSDPEWPRPAKSKLQGTDHAPPVPLSLLGAFPGRFHGTWIATRGQVGKVERSDVFPGMREIVLSGLDRSVLRIVVWSIHEKELHRYFATLARKKPMAAEYVKGYDYEGLNKTLDGLRPGSRIWIAGRLWHNLERWPSTVWEIWDVKDRAHAEDGGEESVPSGSDPQPGATYDPSAYLRRQMTLSATTSLLRKEKAELLGMGNAYLAKAYTLGLERLDRTDWKTLWEIAAALQDARSMFMVLSRKDRADPFGDQLVTETTGKLIRLYREISRK